ncbi:MAG: hypothetical protein ABIW50_01215, partial [Candidatus Limnocylindria bacterium]
YQQRPPGGDRPFTPRPHADRPPDEGGMSIRLDPRRVNALKHLAGEAGVRPGDLVRQWVEERIDASRPGAEATPAAPGQPTLLDRIAELDSRVAALEGAPQVEQAVSQGEQAVPQVEDAAPQVEHGATQGETVTEEPAASTDPSKKRAKRASAAPTERVALHDEMIVVLRASGPMRAADLAEAIVARGRYQVPRSGKALDGKTVSQRVSNPTYRARFTRDEGMIGLAEG